MYDTEYVLLPNNIQFVGNHLGYLISRLPIIPLPDRNRIHPLDREFKGLIKRKQKLFISSSK